MFIQNLNCGKNGKTTVTINGVTKTYEGSISIINGKVFVNGKPVEDHKNIKSKDNQPIIINVTGNVDNIEKAEKVHITGDVKGNIEEALSVHVEKDCHGSIDSTGNVTIGGNCKNIDTTGDVTVNGNCSGKIDTVGNVRVGSNNRKW